jgi:hypothetical protein
MGQHGPRCLRRRRLESTQCGSRQWIGRSRTVHGSRCGSSNGPGILTALRGSEIGHVWRADKFFRTFTRRRRTETSRVGRQNVGQPAPNRVHLADRVGDGHADQRCRLEIALLQISALYPWNSRIIQRFRSHRVRQSAALSRSSRSIERQCLDTSCDSSGE